ncbi:MAG: HAD family hydrolase [Chitinophagales bacterium]
MFKAILFDLDGTLLDIDMDYFLQEYFREMVHTARERGIEAKELPVRVWKASDAMIGNKDPLLTNQQVFEQDFFAAADHETEIYVPLFDEFYQQRFDRLQKFVDIYPLAQAIVKRAFELGGKVAIATNPVFPRLAIDKRLNWAGVGDYPYHLVTTYEDMHFTKPHTEYYQEVADRLGVKPAECLMVGNDAAEDLTAAQLGMKTFLVKDRLLNGHLDVKPDWEGSLEDLLEFLSGL